MNDYYEKTWGKFAEDLNKEKLEALKRDLEESKKNLKEYEEERKKCL